MIYLKDDATNVTVEDAAADHTLVTHNGRPDTYTDAACRELLIGLLKRELETLAHLPEGWSKNLRRALEDLERLEKSR
jgi:hypothetical protein